jgi:AraC-like DNA-binding protein
LDKFPLVFRRVLPPPALRRWIRAFTYWEAGPPFAGRSLKTASCAPSLQIDVYDDELRWYQQNDVHVLGGIALGGVQTRPFGIDAWQPRLVRVLFRPGGTVPFFPIAPAELADTQVTPVDRWHLREQLAAAGNPSDLFDRLGRILTAAVGERTSHPVVARALAVASSGDLTVAALAGLVDVSPKRLIRLFTADVGIPPKRYLRLVRFERLLSSVTPGAAVDWGRSAAAFGYFDQSHLIRDFHDFAGTTPNGFLARLTRPAPTPSA